MLSFEFANQDSFNDYGIYIERRPSLPSPKRRISYVSVPGRSGSLTYDEATYEDITISIECGILGDVYTKMDAIKGWLLGSGKSTLVFSFQKDKCYHAQVVNSIDFTVSLGKIGTFVLLFQCEPFRYAVNNAPITIASSGTNLIHTGTIASDPRIEVYGRGNVRIQVNDQELYLYNLNETIIIDSTLQDVYNERYENKNEQMKGPFPKLEVGSNVITWSGDVTKLIVTPNGRWL